MWKQWQTNLILQRLRRLLQRSGYIHDHFKEIKMSCYNFKALHPFKPVFFKFSWPIMMPENPNAS
ncbi:hypothetical protein T02_10823 [Trichinella nativa]|uniref:Uncharacterized protein n=1 Tax=Trichinella nativa TaxID=6335 RepID=A0A0V1KR30_9BILA|nr:hypothetical protein T06_5160 [Trichinella sp. T6]KRZ49511.1 hypothetical protein T02_10823 [Trichinella nativa]